MKKIAILNCLDANDVCTGAGCLRAWNEKRASFEPYQDENVELCAFLRCSLCGDNLKDPGMQEKLERLLSMHTDVVHIGKCALKNGTPCPNMAESARWLESHGIAVVWGTH